MSDTIPCYVVVYLFDTNYAWNPNSPIQEFGFMIGLKKSEVNVMVIYVFNRHRDRYT